MNQVLKLSNQRLTEYQIGILAFSLEGRNSVKRLDISWNKVTNNGIEAIRNCLLNNDTLLELNMSNCEISGKDIVKIMNASKTLQVLNVSHNNINDYEAHLIGACTITLLQKLNISHNNILVKVLCSLLKSLVRIHHYENWIFHTMIYRMMGQ